MTKRITSIVAATLTTIALAVGTSATPAHAATTAGTATATTTNELTSMLSDATGLSTADVQGHQVDPHDVLGPLVETPNGLFWYAFGSGWACAGYGSVMMCVVWGN